MPTGPAGPGNPCRPSHPWNPRSPRGPADRAGRAGRGSGRPQPSPDPPSVSATVAIVMPPETAKSTTATTKPIRIDRCQRMRLRRVGGVDPGVDRLLTQQERPPSEIGEVAAQQVDVFGELVDVLLAGPPVAASELADHQQHPAGRGEDRRDPGEDRYRVHPLVDLDRDEDGADGGDDVGERVQRRWSITRGPRRELLRVRLGGPGRGAGVDRTPGRARPGSPTVPAGRRSTHARHGRRDVHGGAGVAQPDGVGAGPSRTRGGRECASRRPGRCG